LYIGLFFIFGEYLRILPKLVEFISNEFFTIYRFGVTFFKLLTSSSCNIGGTAAVRDFQALNDLFFFQLKDTWWLPQKLPAWKTWCSRADVQGEWDGRMHIDIGWLHETGTNTTLRKPPHSSYDVL